MSAITQQAGRTRARSLARLLDTRLQVGRQYGAPVEITAREALRHAPCFLLAGFLMAAVVFG